jgi:hypothetical protein
LVITWEPQRERIKRDAHLTFVAAWLIETVALASLVPASVAGMLRLIVTVFRAK